MSKKKNDDYDVGYGKPPKKNRFGQPDGNPINKKGPPTKLERIEKERLSYEQICEAILKSAKTMVRVKEDGKDKYITAIEAMGKQLANTAMSGDLKAISLLLKHLERFSKDMDASYYELLELSQKLDQRVMFDSTEPGSARHYNTMYNYFSMRRDLRRLEGVEHWIYLDDEPNTNDDWCVLIEYYKKSQSLNEGESLPWPPPYPTHLLEKKHESMSKEERLQDFYDTFKHRKEMREKEGMLKWPFMCEEPVDERDWAAFEEYVSKKKAGDNDAIWPPEYWDDPFE